jgi:hypothetical protein
VERGQHEPSLTQVLGAVEQEHRARADDRGERRIGLSGPQQLGIAGEDLLDRGRVGHEHERPDTGQPDREPVAIAAAARLEEGQRPRDPGEGLERGGPARTRREGRGG